jgi:AraC-like DNA-binding protein
MSKKRGKIVVELAQFDVLGDVLDSLGLKSRLFCRSELAAPWVIHFGGADAMHFHIIERGTAWLEVGAKQPARALAPGDVVVVGRGQGHRLSDQPGRSDLAPIIFPDPPDDGRCTVVRHGQAGGGTVMICGSFAFQHAAGHPLLALLPRLMQIKSASGPSRAWVGPVARMLTAEAAQMRPGAQTIISHLTDVLFVQVLRDWISDGAAAPGWLMALNHPQIGPVLAAVHERPDAQWTVERLAARARLSRTAFSARFAKVVGEPARKYLMRLRMQRAANLLAQGPLSISDVAESTGYESEAAFSKAFKRWHGKTPGEMRRDTGPASPLR